MKKEEVWIQEQETRRVWVLLATGLVLTLFSSSPLCLRNLLAYIEKYQFRVLYPAFFTIFSRKKKGVTTTIMLNMDDRSGTLFSSSPFCLHNLLAYIEKHQLRVLYPGFFTMFSSKKSGVTTTIMLNMDDTFNEDVLMIFHGLEAQNSPLQISLS